MMAHSAQYVCTWYFLCCSNGFRCFFTIRMKKTSNILYLVNIICCNKPLVNFRPFRVDLKCWCYKSRGVIYFCFVNQMIWFIVQTNPILLNSVISVSLDIYLFRRLLKLINQNCSNAIANVVCSSLHCCVNSTDSSLPFLVRIPNTNLS